MPKLFSEQVPIAKAVLGSLGLLAKIDGPDDDNSCVFQQDPSDGRVRKGDTIILKTRQRAGRFCFSRPEFTVPIEFRDRIEILRPNH